MRKKQYSKKTANTKWTCEINSEFRMIESLWFLEINSIFKVNSQNRYLIQAKKKNKLLFHFISIICWTNLIVCEFPYTIFIANILFHDYLFPEFSLNQIFYRKFILNLLIIHYLFRELTRNQWSFASLLSFLRVHLKFPIFFTNLVKIRSLHRESIRNLLYYLFRE